MRVKTAIISRVINNAGLDAAIETVVNIWLTEHEISPDNLIDIKVNTVYCGDNLHNQINNKYVDDDEILINYTMTIIYKTED